MNVLWISLGILGALLIYLVLSDEGATTFGLSNSTFAQAAVLTIWAAIIGTAVIPRHGELKDFARNAAIWILIVLVLVFGYVFRYDLQDVASRMTAGLVPGSPRSVQSDDGQERVVLARATGQHFIAKMSINGKPVTLLVDTGATSTVLTERDAEKVGIEISELSYSVPINTANGRAFAARSRINSIGIGAIQRENLSVFIAKPEALQESLLGMNFLNTLSAFEFRGDELYLTD